MFIENTQYQVDLATVNNIRYILCTNIYCNPTTIASLEEIIRRNIDCLGIEFSTENFSFMVKIKKTAMRKIKGFNHTPNFYYQTISKIFTEFISTYEQNILQAIKIKHPDVDPYQMLQYVYNNQAIMANLCHVTCISDNTIIIKL